MARGSRSDGTLGFFSPDANLVAAFVVRQPVSLIDDLININPDFATALEKLRAEKGFDLRNDLAAPLGGEVALGVDGPLLPEPSWKLVAEVYDTARLETTFERAVQQMNDALRQEGKGGNRDPPGPLRRPHVLLAGVAAAEGVDPLPLRGRLHGGGGPAAPCSSGRSSSAPRA